MINTINEAIREGYWPIEKQILTQAGDSRIELQGWLLFYRNKNKDFYFIPGSPPRLLIVRTDKVSIPNIPFNLKIPGIGEVQNKFSLWGTKYANIKGMYALVPEKFPKWFPDNLKQCSQIIEMCKPLLLRGRDGMKLNFRKYITGSFYKHNKNGEAPYKLKLNSKLPEWFLFSIPAFTPTTNCENKLPIQAKNVVTEYEDLILNYLELFMCFTEYTSQRGLIVVNTKFEAFIDSEGKIALGNDIFTCKSTQFILSEKFNKDNNTLENESLKCKRNDLTLREIHDRGKYSRKFIVDIKEEKKRQVLNGYKKILERLRP